MLKWQRYQARVLKVAAFALLAGTAGCSDDFARLNGGLTTASLGIEPSNQDRIIRKTDTSGVRLGVRPPSAPQQEYPDTETLSDVSEPLAESVTYAAPTVSSDALPPLKPSMPQAVAEAELIETAAPTKRVVRKIEEAPLVRSAQKTARRKITKPKLAAAGIPVVPPASSTPGRLREVGEPILTGSVAPAAEKPAAKVVGGSYAVVSGDTLYGIARRHGISTAALSSANGLSGSALRIGQRLVIPGSVDVAKPAKVAYEAPAKVVPERKAIVTASVPRNEPVKPSIAPKPVAAAKVGSSFSWPARGRIVSSFGQRTVKGSNDGVDIAVPEGTAIKAAADGIVLYSGSELKDFGNLVLVRHDDGWVSAYANASSNLVKRGDRVTRGQTIAKSGKSGNATQPQVHFELRRNSKPLDPERYLKG